MRMERLKAIPVWLLSGLLRKSFEVLSKTSYGRAQLQALYAGIDRQRFAMWMDTVNGSERLQLAYQAVDDTNDCLQAIKSAIIDGDGEEALKFINISQESLADHIKTLKGLL
jgi:hypothetical protein